MNVRILAGTAIISLCLLFSAMEANASNCKLVITTDPVTGLVVTNAVLLTATAPVYHAKLPWIKQAWVDFKVEASGNARGIAWIISEKWDGVLLGLIICALMLLIFGVWRLCWDARACFHSHEHEPEHITESEHVTVPHVNCTF